MSTGHQASSRGLSLLLALWVGSLVGAALLAPAVYWAVERWAESSTGTLATWLGGKSFVVFFDRLRWLIVLAGVPWLCRATGLSGGRGLGLTGRRAGGGSVWPAALVWLGVGVATVAAASLGQLAGGVALPGRLPAPGELAEDLAMALLGAAAIAFLEELVFRGVLFQLFRRALAMAPAVAAAALVFALLHFQSVPRDAWPAGTPVGPGSGFAVAWASLAALPGTIDPPVFLALFLAGAILCLVFLRGGSLWLPMGLHAGWVLGARLHRLLVTVDPDAPAGATALWGSRILIDGVAPLALLAALALVLALDRRRALS